MSSQDLLMGNNFLVQCQQLAHQAALAAAAVASNESAAAAANNSNNPTSNSSPINLHQQLHQTNKLPLDSQAQWTHYHQAIAAAAATVANNNPASNSSPINLHQQHQANKLSLDSQAQWNHHHQAIAAALMSNNNPSDIPQNASSSKLKDLTIKQIDQQIRRQQQQYQHHQLQQQQQQQQQQQNLLAHLMSLNSAASAPCQPSPRSPASRKYMRNSTKDRLLQQHQPATNTFPCLNNAATNLSASSLANLISLTSAGQLQFLPRAYEHSPTTSLIPNDNSPSTLLAKLTAINHSNQSHLLQLPAQTSSPHSNNTNTNNFDLNGGQSFDTNTLGLLETLFTMNEEPEEDAIEMIAQKINSTSFEVANWFQSRRETERILFNTLNPSSNKNTNASNFNSCSSPLNNGSKSPSSMLNFKSVEVPMVDNNEYIDINDRTANQNFDNQILNYSNIPQSILESVLGSVTNEHRLPKNTDVRSLTLDHSENGPHPDSFDESADDFYDSDGDEFLFKDSNCNNVAKSQGKDLNDLKSSSMNNRQSSSKRQTTSSKNGTKDSGLVDMYSNNPFLTLMSATKNSTANKSPSNVATQLDDDSPNTLPSTATCYKANQPPAVPSSTLLAKLSAVTSRPNLHVLVASKLDQNMIDLMEALYAVNDNPEPAAIEMIAKRINTTVELLNSWFDKKRLKMNPNAGPRSPPAKKREGGRVVTFSEYQRSLLEAIFDENNYLHPQEYEELSNLIQVPSRNIKIWFKNRRSKQRLSGRTTTPGSANNSD